MSARLWLALVVMCAVAARAEIYRCEEADGSIRFTGDPGRCAHPVAHTPAGDRVAPDPRAQPSAPDEEAAPAAGDGEDQAPPLTGPALQLLLPSPGAAWEALDDAPETARDPQLVAQGLRASVARHYTRARGPVSEVCTVEVWSFERAAQARAVRDALAEPLWWIRSTGALLVLAHGVRLERQVGTRHGLVPGCESLAESARARAAAAR